MSSNVIFDENRDAVQWSARAIGSALTVQIEGDGNRIRVGFYYGIEFRPTAIDLVDTSQIFLCQDYGRGPPIHHQGLQLGNCCFVQSERLNSEAWFIDG